jgi:hypothetical protein
MKAAGSVVNIFWVHGAAKHMHAFFTMFFNPEKHKPIIMVAAMQCAPRPNYPS